MTRVASVAVLMCTLLPGAPANAAENRHFDSDGVTLRYFIAGEGDTVVLLHGFGGSAEGLYLRPGTFDALAAAGYRVVALDQRGHGNSDKPHGENDYGQQMVEDVRRLIDHLGADRIHLVGYSMGSKVSSAFLERYPDRLMTITLGGFGWPWRGSRVDLDQAAAALRQRDVLPGNDLDALAAVMVGSYDLTPSERTLRQNTVPALTIIGDHDTVVPKEDQQTFQKTMANLEIRVMPGTHAGPDGAPYKPAYAEALIDFLDRH